MMRHFLFLFVLLTAFPGWAQTRLGEALVVGQRAEMETRFDSTTWRRLAVMRTEEALRLLPGVNLRTYGTPGSALTLEARGLGATHTRVVQDGMPWHAAQSGTFDFSTLTLSALSSVAFTSAPFLLLQPAEAMGNVVRVETAETTQNEVSLRATSLLEAEPSLRMRWKGTEAAATWHGSAGRFRYTVRNGDEHYRETRRHAALSAPALRLRQLFALRGTKGFVEGGYRGTWQALPGPLTLYTQDASERLGTQHLFARTRIYKKERWQVAAQYDFHATHYRDGSPAYTVPMRQSYYERSLYGTCAYALPECVKGLRGSVALDARYESLSAFGRNVPQRSMQRTMLTPAATLQYVHGGLQMHARLGVQTDFEATHLYPSFRAAYTLGRAPFRLTPYAYAARSGRLATFTESYFYHLGARAALRPERADQLAVGLDLQTRLVSLKVEAYWAWLHDKIVSTPYTFFIMRTENWENVRTRGIDFTFQTAPLPLAARRAQQPLYAEITTQYSLKTPSLPYTAAHTLHTTFSLEHRHFWSASLTLHAESERWSARQHIASTHLAPFLTLRPAISAYMPTLRAKKKHAPRPSLLTFSVQYAPKPYEIVRRYPMPQWQAEATWKFLWH